MYVYNSRKLIEVWAPAKLNLFLEVHERRSDGFHEIETLMVPINLFDTLTIERRGDSQIRLQCRVASGLRNDASQLVDIPAAADNLVFRVIELLQNETGCSRGLNCTLIKRIPSSAGMGGGSSDAAAALLAANELLNLGCSIRDLASIAEKLGSDIPFFLYSSACVCRGRGERIETIQQRSPLHLVIVKPRFGLSTAQVYRQTQRTDSPLRCVTPIARSVSHGNANEVGKWIFNRLQTSASRISTEITDLSSRFDRLDVLGHQMSGSGSSYFAICRNALHAKQTAAKLNARGNQQTFVARTIGSLPMANTRFCRPSHN